MPFSQWLLVFFSLMEVLLLAVVILFFWRLRRSEAILNKLQQKQEELLNRLHFNEEMEQELMASFEERQRELAGLEEVLSARSAELKKLISRAEEIGRSPHVLREIILKGHRQGRPAKDLARATGLSVDEVELILMEAKR